MTSQDAWAAHEAAIKSLHDYTAKIEAACDEGDGRDWSEEEKAEQDKLLAAVDSTRGRAERIEKSEAIKVPKPGSAVPKLVIPTPHVGHNDKYRTHGRLRAFKGEDAARKAFRFGAFVGAVITGHRKFIDICESEEIDIQAALSTTINTKGGALVADEFRAELISLVEEFGIFRRWADLMPMASDTKIVPVETGGVTTYFPAENAEITASDPAFDNVQLVAKKLAALTPVSSELFEDALIDVGDRVARRIAISFAEKEDDSGWNGDGTSTYGSMVGVITRVNDGSHAGSIYTALTGNTAFSTLDLVDFEGALGQVPMFPGQQLAWFISKRGWAASMMRLADAAGGNTKGDVTSATPMQFLGLPVVWSQKLNQTLTAQINTILCLVGDLSQAAIFGDRRSITIESDQGGEYFKKDQVAIKGTERIDINAHLGLITGTNAGPIIALKTPGS